MTAPRLCARLDCPAALSPIAHGRRIFCSETCRTIVQSTRSSVARYCNRCAVQLAPQSHGLRLYCGTRCWRLAEQMRRIQKRGVEKLLLRRAAEYVSGEVRT